MFITPVVRVREAGDYISRIEPFIAGDLAGAYLPAGGWNTYTGDMSKQAQDLWYEDLEKSRKCITYVVASKGMIIGWYIANQDRCVMAPPDGLSAVQRRHWGIASHAFDTYTKASRS